MNELTEILASIDRARARGADAVLATVVRVRGSTYRRPGARMLMTLDGERIGAISGGCLEKEVGKKAWWLTDTGRPVVVKYDTSADDDVVFEFGLGCQGIVWVMLERLAAIGGKGAAEDANEVAVPACDYLEFVRQALARREACVVATVIAAEGESAPRIGARLLVNEQGDTFEPACDCRDSILPAGLRDRVRDDARAALAARVSEIKAYPLSAGGAVDMFIEVIQPPLPLVICGAGHDAPPVAHAAKQLGWHVTVVDNRSAYATPARFADADEVLVCKPAELARRVRLDAGSVAVLMTHNFADDVAMLRQLVASPVRYIGALGPRSRTAALLHELEKDGVRLTPEQRARFFGPIGLDIGAETPAEIAAAIVAEIQATVTGRAGGHLCERDGPIHKPAADDSSMLDLATGSAAAPTCRIPSAEQRAGAAQVLRDDIAHMKSRSLGPPSQRDE